MTDDEKILHLSIGVGAIETIRYEENKLNPKSARARALNALVDKALKAVDYYHMNTWQPEKLNTAAQVLEHVEKTIQQAFNPKRVGRDDKGRFIKLGGV